MEGLGRGQVGANTRHGTAAGLLLRNPWRPRGDLATAVTSDPSAADGEGRGQEKSDGHAPNAFVRRESLLAFNLAWRLW
jgi:hypothetical protein